MKAMRDAAILLILILAVLSIRITPAEDVAGLVPAAQAAAVESSAEAEPIAPAIHSSLLLMQSGSRSASAADG